VVVLVWLDAEGEGRPGLLAIGDGDSAQVRAVLDAIRTSGDTRDEGEWLEMVDPYHPGRPNVRTRVTYRERDPG
jgi:hypothetical protein